MPLVTCGLSDEGVIAAEVRFSTTPELVLFNEDFIESSFGVVNTPMEFDTEIKVVGFSIDVIRIVGCTLP